MVHEKWQKMIAEHYEVTTDMAWYLQQHEPIMRDLNKYLIGKTSVLKGEKQIKNGTDKAPSEVTVGADFFRIQGWSFGSNTNNNSLF